MDDLDTALAEILAVRDCPAVRNLVLDCWKVGAARGEAEGLKWAAMLLTGVRAYAAREAVIRGPVRASVT